MSSPSSLEKCPEPSAYFTDSYMATVDFPEERAVMNLKPTFVEVDALLSNQLGGVTNPVSGNQNGQQMELSGFPVLPEVGESNAVPVLSSSNGADINSSTTLASNQLENNFLSVSNNVSQPAQPVQPQPVQPQPVVPPTAPTSVSPMQPAQPTQGTVGETFNNVNRVKYNPMQKKTQENFGSYIQNKAPVKKVAKRVEHFDLQKIVMDYFVLILVIGVGVFYIFSQKQGVENLNLQNVPVIGQLTDPNVSDNNKIMLVIGIVVVVVLIARVLS